MMSSKFFLIAMICILPQTWDLGQTQTPRPTPGRLTPTRPTQSRTTPAISTQGPLRPTECERSGFSGKRVAGTQLNNGVRKISFKENNIVFGDSDWDGTNFCTRCPGYYFFSFHAVSTKQGAFALALSVNGHSQVTALGSQSGAPSQGSEYQWASNSIMLKLNKDDCVWLELQKGTLYQHPKEDESLATFTGFLMSSS